MSESQARESEPTRDELAAALRRIVDAYDHPDNTHPMELLARLASPISLARALLSEHQMRAEMGECAECGNPTAMLVDKEKLICRPCCERLGYDVDTPEDQASHQNRPPELKSGIYYCTPCGCTTRWKNGYCQRCPKMGRPIPEVGL